MFVAILSLLRGRLLGKRSSTTLTVAMLLLIVDAMGWIDHPNDGGAWPVVQYAAGYCMWIGAVMTGCVGLVMARHSERGLR